jgi:hypothetical protein
MRPVERRRRPESQPAMGEATMPFVGWEEPRRRDCYDSGHGLSAPGWFSDMIGRRVSLECAVRGRREIHH